MIASPCSYTPPSTLSLSLDQEEQEEEDDILSPQLVSYLKNIHNNNNSSNNSSGNSFQVPVKDAWELEIEEEQSIESVLLLSFSGWTYLDKNNNIVKNSKNDDNDNNGNSSNTTSSSPIKRYIHHNNNVDTDTIPANINYDASRIVGPSPLYSGMYHSHSLQVADQSAMQAVGTIQAAMAIQDSLSRCSDRLRSNHYSSSIHQLNNQLQDQVEAVKHSIQKVMNENNNNNDMKVEREENIIMNKMRMNLHNNGSNANSSKIGTLKDGMDKQNQIRSASDKSNEFKAINNDSDDKEKTGSESEKMTYDQHSGNQKPIVSTSNGISNNENMTFNIDKNNNNNINNTGQDFSKTIAITKTSKDENVMGKIYNNKVDDNISELKSVKKKDTDSNSDSLLGIIWSHSAKQFSLSMKKRLSYFRSLAKPLAEDDTSAIDNVDTNSKKTEGELKKLKRLRRQIGASVQIHITQISGTIEQVHKKIRDITAMLVQAKQDMLRDGFNSNDINQDNNSGDVNKDGVTSRSHYYYLILITCGKLLAQCEIQVSKLPLFVFPLAEVTIGLMNNTALQPEFNSCFVALMHEKCILTVPKWFNKTARIEKKNSSDQNDNETTKTANDNSASTVQLLYRSELSWLTRLGYRPEQDGHSVDEFVNKMQAYIRFYAAIMQSDNNQIVNDGLESSHDSDSVGSRLGLAAGWHWVALLFNTMPCNRFTASVLISFLNVAGYKLHQAFGKQFIKLMHYIDLYYLPALRKILSNNSNSNTSSSNKDSDVSASITRLETFLNKKDWLKEPPGRKMPRTDESSLAM